MAGALNPAKERTELTQYQMFYQEQSKIAQVNDAFMSFVRAGLPSHSWPATSKTGQEYGVGLATG